MPRQALAKAPLHGTIAPRMVLSRALLGTTLGTALGLSLAGCAMDTATRTYSPAIQVAEANRFAAISPAAGPGVQVASLAPVSSSDSDRPAVIQKGTVLWHRTPQEAELPAKPDVSEELRQLRESVSKIQGETTQQMAQLQTGLQTSQRTLAQVQDSQARQERDLHSQTAAAVTNVAALAQESMRSMERVATDNSSRWNTANQQLAQLEGRLQTALTDVRQQQAQTVDSTKAYTDLKVSKSQLESQLAAVREARQAAQQSEARTSQQLAAAQAVQGAQLAAVSQQVATSQQMTAYQLAELRKLNDENRALATSEVTSVAAALRHYADTQFQQAAASTSATLANLAQATDQSVAGLRDQTNRRLGVMWQAANQNAEKLAEQKANAVAASLAALQQQTAADRVTPDQIRAISEKTVAEATPEFRALALRTMQESQDYIRTVARTAVQDKDPAMTNALADAARDVITKDDRVVFAIRKAVADELQGAVAAESGTTTTDSLKLGPDHGMPIAADAPAELDPNRLRIAQLLAPGSNRAAPDSVQTASLSTGAASAGGQQSWSVPGTSLMRARNRADWMDIRQYKVIVHEDDQTLETLLGKVLKHAEPFTGPWQVRWKVSEQNREILTEKFSLDAETSFEEFVSYLAQYVVNDRGVKLTFSLFDNERIILVSD